MSEQPDRNIQDPDLLLLPKEARPWTGTHEAHRYLPERVVVPPPWLQGEEGDAVSRQTWNGFVEVLEREGYATLRQLEERVSMQAQKKQGGREHVQKLVRVQRAKLDEARRMRRTFGAESLIEEAVGKPEAEGWEHRGLSVRWDLPPRVVGEKSLALWQIPLSLQQGETWGEAVSTQESKLEELQARYVSAENSFLIVAFRRDVLEEVSRHYETYGVIWKWDYDDTDVTTARIDESAGAVPQAHRITPHYDWIEETYKEVRPEHTSNKDARIEVIERFGLAFSEAQQRAYGTYEPPSHSSIRRALGEID